MSIIPYIVGAAAFFIAMLVFEASADSIFWGLTGMVLGIGGAETLQRMHREEEERQIKSRGHPASMRRRDRLGRLWCDGCEY